MAGNPVDQNPEERKTAPAKPHQSSENIASAHESGDIRVPFSNQEPATPTSLGYGVRDASKDKTDAEVCYFQHILRAKLKVTDSTWS